MSNKPVAEALKTVLSDTYALYLKTQNYHWNVEGANFRSLHLMFEEQYQELATAVDTTAEMIRTLGEKAPGTFDAFAKNASIKPGNENASSTDMVKELAADQGVIQQTLEKTLEVAEKAGDDVVVDFMTQRLAVHRKAQWMLKSTAA